ncbi:MAG: hypothetical protein ABI561_08385 [Bradyrhizobium sp.]
MSMQPVDRSSNMPAPVLSVMSDSNDPVRHLVAMPKTKSRTDEVRAAKARITRRNSLRKQRQAQRADPKPAFSFFSRFPGPAHEDTKAHVP